MRFCSEAGIPHSTFMAWAPEDRAKQLAFMIEDSARCGLCGTAPWEWEENRRAYEPIETTCPGCYAKAMVQEGSDNRMGSQIRLVPSGSHEHLVLTVKRRREADRERRKRRAQREGQAHS